MKIIAEFCQNHNGNFDTLKRMISAAAESGATHGKIQTIFADDLSFRPEFEEGLTDSTGEVKIIKRPYQAEYDRLKKLELTYAQHEDFVLECGKAGIIPLTTAFNITCIPRLKDFGWESIKVASYDCGALPLIKSLCENFQELIVSTGASYDEEIAATADYLNISGTKYSLLHCVTIYPTPLAQMNLRRMDFLKKFVSDVGLSDHSLVSADGVKAALAAIYVGAQTIERHFTILPENETRDGRVSIRAEHIREIAAFAKLSHSDQANYISEKIPEFDSMLGTESRPLSHAELLNRAYYRGRFCNKNGNKQIYNWEYAE